MSKGHCKVLNNREISERFEVQINTLYNWQKSKPKLYSYLQHADYHDERHQEINILLAHYSKSINRDFSVEEIHYIINSDIELHSIDEIEKIQKVFITHEAKNLSIKSTFLLHIYDKLQAMNLIEKYIFYKHIFRIREKERTFDAKKIQEYFSEYLAT
jgi:transposase